MIRYYRPDDLCGCAAVFCASFQAEPWKEQWTEKLAETRISELMNTPLSVGYVCEENGRIIGFAAGRAVTYLYGKEYVIDELCVHPEMQGQGVGSQMIAYIYDDRKAAGNVGIVLQTTKGYPSEKFYLKNGFVHNADMVTMYRILSE